MSLQELHSQLIDIQLTHLWNQWTVLGVAGYAGKSSRIIDPEALLLFTLETARFDARLYDEVLDWCTTNGMFLSIPRIKSLLKRFSVQRQVAALAELVSVRTRTQKWKTLADSGKSMTTEPLFLNGITGQPFPIVGESDPVHFAHGLLRSKCVLRKHSLPFPSEEIGSLILKLRALIGVTVRCEIIVSLLDGSEKHPSRIARETDYYQKTVQDTISEMVRSAFLTQRAQGREKLYHLEQPLRALILNGRSIKLTPWILLYELLGRLNATVNSASQKGISFQTTLVLCQKEIARSENGLISAGYSRDVISLKNVEELPVKIERLLLE
ncbi:MAG: hypothetical protein JW795_09070 [Chitinivibrionales bacterium]|nr:hypothetical protein [Chitinivibrionales bacterium]